ncbi:urokinase plasminogen activator surface receptor-like isoform X1 [Ahaetulla prasina]|uniref:urokinase plasminogen activator surface receptor-like isoform X1 n=1 Tax=Ahaetulla prasina TaxID=499056 RepID=UPI002648F17F|nr:urokinase plasminogen activator surface receptor-like isoform X1 [Ahaetulla prasina]XP_058050997.1 urokinase plasminogen activator surface receptor-like isoform X1 [Ahaetulla prasina]
MDKGSITIFIFCLGMANSLECYKCLINEGNCSKAPVEVCRPNQNACFTVIKKYHGLSADTAKQGCGSSNDCRRYPMGTKGSLFRTMWCCSTNLCQPIHLPVNRDGSQNNLLCQSCIGSPAECGLTAPSQQCSGSADRCVQISQRFLPGEKLEPIIKGCGNSSFKDLQVLYQIGKDFAFLDQKVCGQPNCNNRSFPEILTGQPNGLQCYSYRGSGREERILQEQQILRCTGAMNRCVRIIKGENKSTAVTIQKGCATESMCWRDTDIYLRLKRENSRAECCQRNLCNKAHSPTNPELVAILSLWLVLKVYQ